MHQIIDPIDGDVQKQSIDCSNERDRGQRWIGTLIQWAEVILHRDLGIDAAASIKSIKSHQSKETQPIGSHFHCNWINHDR